MPIKVGDKVPSVTLRYVTPEGVKAVPSEEFFANRKVAVFGLPGAYTRTCSSRHLPGYVQNSDVLKQKGIDTIACLSVNDAFVMDAWGRSRDTGDAVVMLADGNGDFTEAIGLQLDGRGFGLGMRSQRYAAVVVDGVLRDLWVESAPTDVTVSSADAVLKSL